MKIAAYEGLRLPLLIEPASEGDRESAAFASWAAGERDWLEQALREHGALLFRGFALDGPEGFQRALKALDLPPIEYVGGNSPRTSVLGNIYTSTEYPAEYDMALHNELAYANEWPAKIAFFCVVPPEHAGETPIVDCREIAARLDPVIKDRFRGKAIKYVRNLHGGRGVGKSWPEAFGTEVRSEVEELCRRSGTELTWSEDGGLRTTVVRPAFARHPSTGAELWFNQVVLFHPSTLAAQIQRIHKLFLKRAAEKPLFCTYEDDTPIDEDDLAQIRALIAERQVAVPWRRGDLLLLDNMLVAHGRRSFTGPRQILVAMSGLIRTQDLSA